MSLYCSIGNGSNQEAFSIITPRRRGRTSKGPQLCNQLHHVTPKKRTDKWFVTTRGTHWTVAGSVTVIILGSYLIYSSHDISSTIAATTPAVELER